MHPEIQPAALTTRRAGAIVAAVFAALAAQSWRRWTDPLIDFGAELYVPWRLLEGDRLYDAIIDTFVARIYAAGRAARFDA